MPPERQQILGLKVRTGNFARSLPEALLSLRAQGGVLRADGPLSAFNIYEGQKIVLMETKPAPGAAPPPPGTRRRRC